MRRLRRKVEPPTSRAAAQAQLDAKKVAQAAAAAQEDDEPYVYLPPGSSMRCASATLAVRREATAGEILTVQQAELGPQPPRTSR